MEILDKMDNIYVLDCKMRGCDHYMSAYLVVGKEVALVDTGQPNRIEETRKAINAHGFSISDISAIFVTHEHRDHGGNVAPFLRESPKARVYLNPLALNYFIRPESINREAEVSSAILDRPGERDPVERVPKSRIKILHDGDKFDLGDGESLKVMFTPGHTPGGLVIFEKKHNGLFINDLAGNCFFDADSQYPLNPITADHLQTVESLKKLVNLQLSYVYLGHYGIYDKPGPVITKALKDLQRILDIGRKYMKEGRPELIADEVYQTILPELEKLRPVRGEELYQYAVKEHIPYQANLFAQYCQRRLS